MRIPWLTMMVAVLVSAGSAVRAELVNLGGVTQDTETGLDWLDLTETADLSFDEVASPSSAWSIQGWRHATSGEYCSLTDRFAIPVPIYPDVSNESDVACSDDTSNEYLVDLLDPTHVENNLYLFKRVTGHFDDSDFSAFDEAGRGQIQVAIDHPSVGDVSCTWATADSFNTSTATTDPSAGHFLVRPNACDPLIPGACQGDPVPPPSACIEQPDGTVECPPMVCPAACRPCGPNPCGSYCFCEWTGPEFPSQPSPGPILVTYSMSDPGLFIGIDEFPAGSVQPMTVFVNGQSVGAFDEGDSLSFSGFPGGGVSEFSVVADMSDPEAFALVAPLDAAGAAFTISVPEPNILIGMIAGVGTLVGVGRRPRIASARNVGDRRCVDR